MKDKAKLIDRSKNIAIFLLTVSACFLLFKAVITEPGNFLNAISDVFSGSNEPNSATSIGSVVEHSSSSPFFILVTTDDGYHYSEKYDYQEKEKLYLQFSAFLGEALGSAGSPSKVSASEWEQALSKSGVFFDYIYPQPLSSIATFLGTKITNSLSPEFSRRLYLSSSEEYLYLYFISSKSSEIYRCRTALASSSLLPKLSEYSMGNASFAFETGPENALLDPYFIFSEDDIQLRSLTATNPLRNNIDRDGILALFGMNSSASSEYVEKDGSVVYVEGNKSLRIDISGSMLFSATGGAGVPIPSIGDEITANDCIAQAGKIAQSTIGATAGEGHLSLYSALNGNLPSSGIIRFCYSVNGIPVQLTSDAPAAEFQINDGYIVRAELKFRSYAFEGEKILPLPEKQASVIAAEQGGEPVLMYSDSSNSVSWTWALIK